MRHWHLTRFRSVAGDIQFPLFKLYKCVRHRRLTRFRRVAGDTRFPLSICWVRASAAPQCPMYPVSHFSSKSAPVSQLSWSAYTNARRTVFCSGDISNPRIWGGPEPQIHTLVTHNNTQWPGLKVTNHPKCSPTLTANKHLLTALYEQSFFLSTYIPPDFICST